MSKTKLLDEVDVGGRVMLEDCPCVVERLGEGGRRLVPMRRIVRCEAHTNLQDFPNDFDIARHVRVLPPDRGFDAVPNP